MNILQTCVGNPGGPIPGQLTYENEKFRNSIVQLIIVNNVNENGLQPDPDFISYPLEAKVSRKNQWVLGDKAIFFYQNCNCNNL